jgi:hypothetical protein
MDKLFDELMERIFLESNFSLMKTKYSDEYCDCQSSVYIAKKPQGDYFIYLQLPENSLSYVTNDIQIKLAALIVNHSDDFERVSDGEVKISSSFDKNATLIIFTAYDVSVKNSVMKQAISIEEDPYFFKKQILLIPSMELPIVSSSFDENKNSYISYIQNLISDTERFNEFTSLNMLGLSDKGVEYSFVAKLYEKLPFLALLVAESDQGVLQQKIDAKLTGEQLLECENLLDLDVNNVEGWFSELVKEEGDD